MLNSDEGLLVLVIAVNEIRKISIYSTTVKTGRKSYISDVVRDDKLAWTR